MPNKLQKKILLVEDNPVMMKLMQMALTKENYTCLVADSAAAAIEILRKQIPDIILSDYEMPEMDGFAFRHALLKNPMWKDIPFVFLTAHSDETLILEGLNLNAIDYIVKGTPVSVIISKITNILVSLRTEHERSVQELRNAAESLNVKTTPTAAPELDKFTIDFWHRSFQNYPSGDFIDIIKVNERFCFVVMGDIMGKKWKAWFFTFGFLSYIRSAIRFCVLDKNFTIAEILEKVNSLVCIDESLSNILSSMSLLMLDNQTGYIHYSGAGDLPLVKYNTATGQITSFTSSGLLLGISQNGLYDDQLIEMEDGDQLLLFTDGLIDIIEDEHTKSDYHSFVEQISAYMGKKDSFSIISKEILQKITGDNQVDDASIIFIQKKIS